MSDIFLSYKSEDASRIAPLAEALRTAGFDVWWDRLSGGENWQAQIQTVLASVKCVIVAWTHASGGPVGNFVRDEAREGKRRGILVPIKLDRVAPPLGFGEIQAIDLTRWKGSARDPFFQDLVAAVKAKIEGRPVAAAQGPAKLLRQRLTYGSVLTALAAAIGALGSNTFHIQDNACAVPQAICDLCGTLGLGGRPTKPERVAWQSLQPGNCDDLRKYLGRFPDGAYRARAQSLLADYHVKEVPVWRPLVQPLALNEDLSDTTKPTRALAKADALNRAQPKAMDLCNGFPVSRYRLKTVRIDAHIEDAHGWNGDKIGAGWSCGFNGRAICERAAKAVLRT